MNTIAIPKELINIKDLIAVPQATYKEFLTWQKEIKSNKTFKPTLSEKKALKEARKNFTRGKYITFEELKHELGINN